MITIQKTCRYYKEEKIGIEHPITFGICTRHFHDINEYLDCKDCPGFMTTSESIIDYQIEKEGGKEK